METASWVLPIFTPYLLLQGGCSLKIYQTSIAIDAGVSAVLSQGLAGMGVNPSLFAKGGGGVQSLKIKLFNRVYRSWRGDVPNDR